MNKKVIIASALFAALVTPALAFSSAEEETQTAEITVSAAVGATPASTATVSTSAAPTAPTPGEAVANNNVSVTNVSAVNAWSNHANWDAKVYGESLKKNTVGMLNSLEVASYSTSCGSYSAVGATSGAATTTVLNGARNQSNDAQVVKVCYQQPISWGDEAGAYSTTLTHQVLPG